MTPRERKDMLWIVAALVLTVAAVVISGALIGWW
jgi:type II secretory pathway component PulM